MVHLVTEGDLVLSSMFANIEKEEAQANLTRYKKSDELIVSVLVL